MNSTCFKSLGLSAFVMLASSLPVQATPLLGVEYGSTLYDVDPLTGQATNPRDTGLMFSSWTGIAFSPGGALYGLSDAEYLYSIDPDTGAAVKEAGVPVPFGEGDIDFDPTSGTLYGVGFFASGGLALVTIDPNDGTTTTVGVLSTGSEDYSAMAFDATGTLYVIDTSEDELLQVDKSDAGILSTSPLSTPLGAAAGMDFDPQTGTLYVADGGTGSTDSLYTLNVSNGVLTPVGETREEGLAGLEFVPEPTTALVTIFGTLLLVVRRRTAR